MMGVGVRYEINFTIHGKEREWGREGKTQFTFLIPNIHEFLSNFGFYMEKLYLISILYNSFFINVIKFVIFFIYSYFLK